MNAMRIRVALVTVIGVSMAALAAHAADTYKVNPVHSSVDFKVKHMGVSFVSGRFTQYTGVVKLDPKDDSKDSVEVEIKTTSVDTASEARDKHLRANDYFDVEKFPTMTFKSTSIKKKDASKYEVKGDFTLHGVTKPLTLEVEQYGTNKDKKGVELTGFGASFTINRTDYGMPTSAGIADDVAITLALECEKQ